MEILIERNFRICRKFAILYINNIVFFKLNTQLGGEKLITFVIVIINN